MLLPAKTGIQQARLAGERFDVSGLESAKQTAIGAWDSCKRTMERVLEMEARV